MNLLEKIRDTAQSAVSSVSTFASSVYDSVVSEGRAALDSLLYGARTAISTAASTAQAAIAKVSYSGSNGSFLSASEPIQLTGTFFDIAPDNSELIGSPLRQAVQLDTLSGFCMCENPRVELACTEAEQKAVEAFLTGGVYIEL